MPLEPTIADITARLRQSKFPNEQAISQGIVLRALQELAWNTWEREMRESLPGCWLVATNLNNVLKKTIIRLAAEVAGLSFGKDLVIGF
jgi:hypothetical protein